VTKITLNGKLALEFRARLPDLDMDGDPPLTARDMRDGGGTALAILGSATLAMYGGDVFGRALRLYGDCYELGNIKDKHVVQVANRFAAMTIADWPIPPRPRQKEAAQAFNSQVEADIFVLQRAEQKRADKDRIWHVWDMLKSFPFPARRGELIEAAKCAAERDHKIAIAKAERVRKATTKAMEGTYHAASARAATATIDKRHDDDVWDAHAEMRCANRRIEAAEKFDEEFHNLQIDLLSRVTVGDWDRPHPDGLRELHFLLTGEDRIP